MELVRPSSAVAWELRSAWATGRRVALSIDGDETRAEGFVTTVAATGAYCKVGGLHVPLERVLAVHRPVPFGGYQLPGGRGVDWADPASSNSRPATTGTLAGG